MIFVKVQTTNFRYSTENDLGVDEVIYTGELPIDEETGEYLILWDNSINNIRPLNEAELLARKKKKYIDITNFKVGEKRKQFITDIPGQSSSYDLKKEEVQRYRSGDTDPSHLPIVSVEADRSDVSLSQMVTLIETRANFWIAKEALINGAKITAAKGINTATDEGQMQQALSDFEAELGAI